MDKPFRHGGFQNQAATDEDEREANKQAMLVIFAVPLAVFSAIPIFLGWLAARYYMPYRIVKAVVFPTGFIISNLLMVMPLLTILFFAAFRGQGGGGLGETFTDMVMWESFFLPMILWFWSIIFGTGPVPYYGFSPNGTHPLLIIGYQVAVWWFIGRHVNKHFAMALYDNATVKIARNNQMGLLAARRRRAELDKGYLAETLTFQKRNAIPFMSPIAVAWAGGDFNEMYYE